MNDELTDDPDELTFQDVLAHLRDTATQVEPRSGRWRFQAVRAADQEVRLVQVEHQREPGTAGFVFVRVARGAALPDRALDDPEREVDLRGVVAYVLPGEIQAAIPLDTLGGRDDLDAVLQRVLGVG